VEYWVSRLNSDCLDFRDWLDESGVWRKEKIKNTKHKKHLKYAKRPTIVIPTEEERRAEGTEAKILLPYNKNS
jgi:hypothetical protein